MPRIFEGRGGCNSEVVHRKEVKSEGWRDSPHVLAIILFFFINCKYIYNNVRAYIIYSVALEEYDSPITEPSCCQLQYRASSVESGTRTRTLYSRGFSGFPLGLCHCHIFQLRQLVYSLYTFCLARRSFTSPI